jgi:hypothetical protein
MTLVLQLPPELEQRLTEEAKRQGISTSDFALRVLNLHLRSLQDDFEQAADYVLQKNAELYRRLT